MIKNLLAAASVAALTFALPAQAATVVQWDFQTPPADLTNSAVSPSVAASTGTGIASGLHASADTDWTTPAGNGSTDSFSSNTWAVGDYWQFSFSTTGYIDLTLSFDQTGSGTGPRDFTLAYSTNGSTFTNFASYALQAITWTAGTNNPASTITMDLSAISTLDNSATVFIRLVDASTVAIGGGAVGTGGTDRVDNFTVNLSPVPEAGTLALMLAGLAAVGFVAQRRR